MLKEGDKAPTFTLGSDSGSPVTLPSKPGHFVVVYFYPRDSTPGCTREAQDFTRAAKAIAKAGAKVYGVSKENVGQFAAGCSY